ncbi:MAG: hypothetical protein J6C26_07905 [Clostridia bacterium]|nr:hypothetical protein [Clostridia bacterium]
MSQVLLVLRWLFFFASLCGWFCLLSRIPKVNRAFLPIVTLSGWTSVLFLLGMIGLLRFGTWMLVVLGAASFVLHGVLALRKRFSFSFLCAPGMIFFSLASAFTVLILLGASYYHYDNFSHWGTVLGEMYTFHDFPTAESIVVFRDYAPSTASFLYSFGSVVGRGEDVALMGQAMLSCAALSALFFRVKKIRSFRFWATAILSLTLACLLVYDDGTLQIYNLLVDALIGFVSIAAWFIREEHRKKPLMGWFLMTPVLILLVLLKKNAVVLFLFLAVFVLYDAWHCRRELRKKRYCILPIALPLLFLLLWWIYRLSTYGAPEESYGYTGILNQLTSASPEFFSNVFSQVWTKITDFSQIYVSAVLGINAALLVGLIGFRRHKVESVRLWKAVVLVNGVMIGYLLCMIFLYCFIMVDEAANLAAFERYMVTPLILAMAIGAHALLDALFHIPPKRVLTSALSVALSLFLFLFVAKNGAQLVVRPSMEDFERGKVMTALQDASQIVPRNAAVAVYNGERGRRDLYYYLTMYEVKSRRVFILDFGFPEYSISVDVNMLRDYEYLVVCAEDDVLIPTLQREGFCVEEGDSLLYHIEIDASDRVVLTPISQ